MQKIILISLALIALTNAQMQLQNTVNVTVNNEKVTIQWNYTPKSIQFYVMSSLNGINPGIEFSFSMNRFFNKRFTFFIIFFNSKRMVRCWFK
jgi:hypothetical protein